MFLASFLQVSISGVILRTEANISRLGWLVKVAQELVRFRKLKRIGLNVRCGFRKKPLHCIGASQYLASQRLFGLKWLISRQPFLLVRNIVRDCQKLSETSRMYFTCIFSNTLRQCLHVYSYPIVAFSTTATIYLPHKLTYTQINYSNR